MADTDMTDAPGGTTTAKSGEAATEAVDSKKRFEVKKVSNQNIVHGLY